MREPIYLGQYFRVKPNTTFKPSKWCHQNHYKYAIFKVERIDKHRQIAQVTCNICFKPSFIDLSMFHLYYQISNTITIKQTPNQLYL